MHTRRFQRLPRSCLKCVDVHGLGRSIRPRRRWHTARSGCDDIVIEPQLKHYEVRTLEASLLFNIWLNCIFGHVAVTRILKDHSRIVQQEIVFVLPGIGQHGIHEDANDQ